MPIGEVAPRQQRRGCEEIAIECSQFTGQGQCADRWKERGHRRLEQVRLEPQEVQVEQFEPVSRAVHLAPWRSVDYQVVSLSPERAVAEGDRGTGRLSVDREDHADR